MSDSLPPLKGTATLDTAPFRKGAQEILADLRSIQELSKKVGTVRVTADLSATRKLRSEFDDLRGKTSKPIEVPVKVGRGTREINAIDAAIRELSGTVRATRNLWQTQIITDGQAARSAEQLRDKLLKLAAAEGASADAVVKATQAAASAQRTLDAARGTLTKGGFAASASVGILDALSRVAGPVGAAAAGIGQMVNSGILSGLRASKPQVGKGAEDIGEAVINSLKTKLEIRSPSRVTARFGQYAADGLAIGMKSGQAQVAKAGFDLGKSAENGISAGLGGNFGQKLSESLRVSGGAFGGFAREANNGAAQASRFALSAEAITFAAGAATGAVVALGAGLAAAVRSGAAFEEQLVNIKALTQPTAQELEQLQEAALNLGTDIGVGPREAAAAILELNKAGLSASDAIGGGLAGALNLAKAAGIEAGQATNLAVSAMTAFGLSAKDLPGVADTFANFANKTTLGADDLAQAIAAVGPVAKSAGLDLNEFSGYMATLAQGGFKNMSDAGTSLKTMLLSLQAPSTTAAAALEQLGLDVYDASGAMRPLADVLADLRAKLAGLTEEQRNGYLKDIFGSDGIRAATILYKASAAAIDENIKAMGLQGEAARVARERMESFAGQVQVLRANWERFTAQIGLALLPALTEIVRGVSAAVEALGDMGNNAQTLRGYLVPLGVALTGVGTAILYVKRAQVGMLAVNTWAALAAFPTTAAAAITTKLIPALGSAAAASAAFIAANPWLLVIAGVTAAGVAVTKLSSDITTTYNRIDEANAASSRAIMDRVAALRKEGDELSRQQARTLAALDELTRAQQGKRTWKTFWTGEYEVDEAAVARATAEYKRQREELGRVRAAQQARARATTAGTAATVAETRLTEDQTKALRELRRELGGRARRLQVEGLSELGRDLASLQDEFDQLREKVKEPFIVKGKLDLNNPQLQAALRELDEQFGRESAAIRRRHAAEAARERREQAQEAAKSARDYALEVQRAEVEAMAEGAAKVRAQRQLELADLQRSIREKVEAAKGFPAEQRRIEELGRRELAALRASWHREDLQRQAEEARERREELERQQREQVDAIRDATLSARRAEIEAMADGKEKLRAQRQLELDELVRGINERIRTLAAFPEAQRRIYEEGQRQVAAVLARYRREDADAERRASEERRKRAEDDARAAREAALRIAQAWRDAREAQGQARLAALDEEAAQYELNLSRNLAAARDNAETVARLEAQAIRDRAAHADRVARERFRQERAALDASLAEALSAEGVSAERRSALQARHFAQVQALARRYQADELGRIAAREQAEREAAERIRQARLKTALRPAEDAAEAVTALQREQQLAESTAQRLALQGKITGRRQEEAAALGVALARADRLKLTEDERRDLTRRLEDAQHEVTLSQREQVKLQDQLTGEAREIVNLYGQFLRLTGTETGVAAAQRELAEATAGVGDAYSRALPYLQQFRDQSLKPEDFNRAKDALGGLITALEEQRQKLEQLRGEYTRQRDALQSVQDVLKGFGQEFGDESLLNNAIAFNQSTYDQAKTALDTLLKGGKYDAAQLAEATRNLQQSYGGLKDAVVALGEARAREYERERDRIKKESDARLKSLDEQIEAAKRSGLDTSALERERDTIVRDTERRVAELEGRAEAARKAAQDALSERTKGLQQLLQGVGRGAATAGRQVDELGQQVQKSEKEVRSSADRMRQSLEGAFKGVPALAGKAGADAGKQFMAQLQKQLKAVKLPGITTPGTPSLPATRPAVTNITQTFVFNNKDITGQVGGNMKTLLRALANEAEAECRRRNA
ncbi:phage tail tape measure protein [Deinococcus sp. YIM 77859]|uniref:phage tail tape measure protein n=1 Tax=Deinococcus sp. YIM 77859 TaxID=1540221 RepID=UPI00055747D0|nr:phage tail tape measure protein [Deinococcus sp. YIM 77859]